MDNKSLESALDHAIEFGAEDVVEEDGVFQVFVFHTFSFNLQFKYA